MTDSTIYAQARPLIQAVENRSLRDALDASYQEASSTLAMIEETFRLFSEKKHDLDLNRQFIKSWHSTHLKMLPIYGLSCRLQKRGMASQGEQREHYFLAAVHNAETSYEDLDLEAQYGKTHTALFDELADAICDGDSWNLNQYCIDEAGQFKQWIYDSMVSAPLERGLLTNMFSEIYNHGEYAAALPHFDHLLNETLGFDGKKAHRLALYIRCHVEDDVEEAHFKCVLDALDYYNKAENRETKAVDAKALFDDYLRRMGATMGKLHQQLIR
ncbi:hypothetical protein ACQZV8_01990 [Magnetococcales bacterium HHB-1]